MKTFGGTRGPVLAAALGLLLTAACWGQEELIEERQGHREVPSQVSVTDERIAQLKVPEGFRVNVFARGLGAPRMMAVDEDGTVYVTRRRPGDVVALRDTDGDGVADERRSVVEGLDGVHGIALHEGKMYLATVRELYAAPMQAGRVGEPARILSDLPPGGNHPNRTLGFGPDGMLYITVGSTCNACVEEHSESATVVRVSADGGGRTIFAKGLRNTVGFGWHPQTGEMWGMDHGTDWLGDTEPPEELNRLLEGKHYGWPFVYGARRLYENINYGPLKEDPRQFAERTEPMVLGYEAHAAPLQMAFYAGRSFPAEYRGDAFIAMHGSWNRKPPVGYEVVRLRFQDGRPQRFEPFLTGFMSAEGRAYFGRPAGLAVAADGALLVGDDSNGVIYRVGWQGEGSGAGENAE